MFSENIWQVICKKIIRLAYAQGQWKRRRWKLKKLASIYLIDGDKDYGPVQSTVSVPPYENRKPQMTCIYHCFF